MIGSRIARTVLTQLYVSITVGSLWAAAVHFTWPGWVRVAAGIAAAAVLAGAALFLSWWTRHLGDGIPAVERAIRGFAWFGVAAVAVVASVIDWRIGVQSTAFVLFVAGKTWHDHADRLWQWALSLLARPALVAGAATRPTVPAHLPARKLR